MLWNSRPWKCRCLGVGVVGQVGYFLLQVWVQAADY